MELNHRSTRVKQQQQQHHHQSSIKVTVAIAGEDIEASIKSPVITVDSPIDVSTVFWQEDEHCSKVVESELQIIIERGIMTSTVQPNTWMRHVQFSGNCHVQNLQITTDNKGNLVLQTIRKIVKSEPLYAWFTIETSKMFNIPYLALTNIQGDQQYKCHQCDITYKNPNPLKIHLAFFCNESNNNNEHRNHFHQLTTSPSSSLFETNTSSSYSAFRSPTRPQHRILRSEIESIRIQNNHSQPGHHFLPMPSYPIIPFPFFEHYNFTPTILTHHSQSQILINALRNNCGPVSPIANPQPTPTSASKTFVHEESPQQFYNSRVLTSNDLSSNSSSDVRDIKKRHKCNYCGKLYSRKYGLKIHIRTHTGYKPLQCKVCLRPFGDPSNLNKHVRLHAKGTTPYKCDLCGKVLVRRRDLQRHMKSRHSNDNLTERAKNNESHKQPTSQ